MSRTTNILTVDLADSGARYTLREVCERGGCHAELVIKMVSYGIVEPIAPAEGTPELQWEFDVSALARLQKALRLQRDLNINLAGLAMSLDLLDEVEIMRKEIAQLRQQLAQFYGGSSGH